jgi:hypothetical protein
MGCAAGGGYGVRSGWGLWGALRGGHLRGDFAMMAGDHFEFRVRSRNLVGEQVMVVGTMARCPKAVAHGRLLSILVRRSWSHLSLNYELSDHDTPML